jgi:hypothetical protein
MASVVEREDLPFAALRLDGGSVRVERRKVPESRTRVISQPASTIDEGGVHIQDVLAGVEVTMAILRRDAEHDGVVDSLGDTGRQAGVRAHDTLDDIDDPVL